MPASRRGKQNGKESERIVATPGICGGSWRINGTRISVKTLARSRELGITDQELLEDYPSLTAEDLAAAWIFAAKNLGLVRS
jgi:uncharacterized protein (DUF433 family)